MNLRRAAALVFASVIAVAVGCGSEGSGASARVVSSRVQLVGGDRALGDIGDYMLENERIRVVIQRPGFSRGFGVYGGSLIDADLRRPSETGTSGVPVGNDQFGELFPAFFVQAVAVDRVSIANDGADGEPASVVAEGDAGDFLELAALLNRAVTGSNLDAHSAASAAQLHYSTTYEVGAGERYVTLRFRVQNVSPKTLRFPSDLAAQLLGLAGIQLADFRVPLGDIALFGATSNVWIPGIGFDSRFGLEDAYERKVDFPAFPGIVAEWIASRGQGASYGLLVDHSPRNFVVGNRAIYDDGSVPIDDTSMLVPFSASSFLGVFHDTAPAELAAGASFETVKYFVIGSGDVGSVLDTIQEIRGTPTGTLGGQVFDSVTGVPALGTSVLVYQKPASGKYRIYSQYDVRGNGSFGGSLAPGVYGVRVQGPGRPLSPMVDVTIAEGTSAAVRLTSVPPGRIVVRVVDPSGHPLPAKATAVGTYGAEHAGQLTRDFLYDLRAGEPFRATDLVDDDPARDETRQYIENVSFTDDGNATLLVRPGDYTIVTSRGPEYDLAQTAVSVGAGETRSLTHRLTRVVDTAGFIAGDMHIHSRNSIDSSMTLDERVRALAAEGVEWAVATDHNYVTDYRPYVERNNLNQWIYPTVGMEMTTLESGHFNGYPLRYEPGPVTHGSFAWAGRAPEDLFGDLRGLGSLGPKQTFIQVNHPRDGVLGYFSQYRRDPLTEGESTPSAFQQVLAPTGAAFRTTSGASTFTLSGVDGIEVANGKLFQEIHHYRVPDVLPDGDLPSTIPPAGHILRKASGEIGFPGVVDDWFNLLNLGQRLVAVGTADSHSGEDEAGYFRSMLYVGDDRPITLTDQRLVDALRTRHVVATNGPLIDFWIDDPVKGVMGQTLRAHSGTAHIHLRLTSAPWAGVARVNVWRNGTIAKVLPIAPSRDLAANPYVDDLTLELAKRSDGVPIDTWFVLEAIGYQNFFPAVKPEEVPRVLLTDAIATLAGPLGLGSDEFGVLRPPDWFPLTAFAITNPVWLTTTDGDFQPPGVVPFDILDRPENDPKLQAFHYPRSTVRRPKLRKLEATTRTTDRFEPRGRVPLFYPRADNPADVRKAFSRFGHLAGHVE